MARSALVASAAWLAACGEGGITDPTEPTQVKVGDFPALSTVGALTLIDGRRSAKRTGADTFTAFSRACTHAGSAVGISGSGFVCPNHGAQYDSDGKVTLGPATRNLTVLSTSYDAQTDVLTIG